jgi:hypothetical protein
VVPDGYRQFLRHAHGEQQDISANDFADLVRENRPEWLVEIIRSLAPDSATSDDIHNELQRLLNDLRVKRISLKFSTVAPLVYRRVQVRQVARVAGRMATVAKAPAQINGLGDAPDRSSVPRCSKS